MKLPVKEAAEQKGINTVAELARASGLARSTVRRLIQSKKTRTATLEKVSKALQVPVVELFDQAR